jgi:hypothetical protein
LPSITFDPTGADPSDPCLRSADGRTCGFSISKDPQIITTQEI